MRTRPRLRFFCVAVLAAALVACTGDDDDAAPTTTLPPATTEPATATSTSATTEPSTSTAPPTTAAASTTTTVPPPSATRTVVGPITDTEPSSTAGQLLPAANGRGFLLVGTQQARPGERRTPTLWESGDAAVWADAPANPALAEGVSASASAGVWVGPELVIAGSVQDDIVRNRPAVWSAPDGWTFAASTDPFGVAGSVVALAVGPAGLVAGGVGITPEDGTTYPMVAVRTEAGWTPTNLPNTPGVDAGVNGLAANATTVVATGSIDTGDVFQAAVWTSVDGGRTFTPGDVSSVHVGLGSSLGAVVATPAGFAALACTANGPTTTTALVTSPDGITWQRVEIVATSATGERYPNVIANCSSLIADGDRLIAGGRDVGQGHVLAIGSDGQGDDLLAPRGRNLIADSTPLAVRRTDGRIGAVSRETRGFSAGLAKADDLPDGTGLPPGRPQPAVESVVALVDQVLVGGSRFPVVTETGTNYSWTSEAVWATSVDGAAWAPAGPDVVPTNAGLVRSGNGIDIAFAWSSDPADDTLAGPALGTTAFVRTAGQPWESVGLIASGPGGDGIDDAIAVPGGFVAVGYAAVRDANGVSTTRALAFSSTDGRTWVPEATPPASDRTSLSQLCPLPDGSVLATGSTVVGDSSLFYLARRDLAGAWSEVDRSPFPAELDEFTDCDLVGATAIFLATTDAGQPVTYTTTDGVAFTASPIAVKGASNARINAITKVGDTVYGVGTRSTGLAAGDAAVWRSADGVTWEPFPVVGLTLPGDQVAVDVGVSPAGALVVAGYDRDEIVTWTVTPG